MIRQIMVILASQRTCHRLLHSNSIAIKRTSFFKCGVFHTGSNFSLMNQRLCRNTADIDTRSSIHFIRTFNNGDFPPTFCKLCRKGLSSLTETDNNNIKCIHIYITFNGFNTCLLG